MSSARFPRLVAFSAPLLRCHARSVPSLSSSMASLAAPPTPTGTCRIAVCQLLCCSDKAVNVETATAAIREAAANKANIVVLPECWNSPYATDKFPEYAEPIPARKSELDPVRHLSSAALSKVARETGVYLVGGESLRWQNLRRRSKGQVETSCCLSSNSCVRTCAVCCRCICLVQAPSRSGTNPAAASTTRASPTGPTEKCWPCTARCTSLTSTSPAASPSASPILYLLAGEVTSGTSPVCPGRARLCGDTFCPIHPRQASTPLPSSFLGSCDVHEWPTRCCCL